MTYVVPNKLLSTRNAKTIKGEKMGFTTYIMYLAPFTQNSKGINLCSHASAGCAQACLFSSGNARFSHVQRGKVNKTEYFLHDREMFLKQLVLELHQIVALHSNIDNEMAIGKTTVYKNFAVRLNGTSDIVWEKFKIKDGKNIFELFPTVQFYDYTKNPFRFDRVKDLKNYHLTFSRSETNDEQSEALLKQGYNVAYVFDKLPTTYKGFEVVNGDETDLRFLDKSGVVVGLKYKKVTVMGGGAINADVQNGGFIVKIAA